MSYLPNLPDYIAFSTTTTLANNETYDSGVLSLIGYTQVQTDILSDVDGTITILFCSDSESADVVRTLTIPYVGGSGYQLFSAPAFTPYVKYQFTATESGQTDFYFDTKLLTTGLSPQVLGVNSYINPNMVSTLGRSVIAGRTEGGYFQNVNVDEEGGLKIAIDRPTTAFGEVMVAQPEPVMQVDFVYGLNSRLVTTSNTGSGTVTSSNNMAVVSSSATSSSTALLYTDRYLKYRAGQGAMATFTSVFTGGIAGTKQYAGLATPTLSDGLMFGYDGNVFGIWYITNGSQTHIPQSSWNVDKLDGTTTATNKSGTLLDPTKGNVYRIQYQYLGFGKIEFMIENEDGSFHTVHRIDYANNYEIPSLGQPSLNMLLYVDNGAVSSDVTVKSASMSASLQGYKRYLGPRNGVNNNKSAITTETNIFTLRNATTYNGKLNRASVRLRTISFGTNAGGTPSGIATLKLIINATLGGSPSFSTIDGTTVNDGVTITNGNSIVSYDTAGTTISGGKVIYTEIVAVQSSNIIDVSDLDIYLEPGDTLTFAVSSTQSATVGVSSVWNEDI